MTPAELIPRYLELGFGLVKLPAGSKIPPGAAWQDNPITTLAEAKLVLNGGANVGVIHAHSGTATLDIDRYDEAKLALDAVGINLDALLGAPGPKTRSKNGVKPFYRLPDHVTLTRHALAWDGVIVFELRAGKVQDVLPPSIHPDTKLPYTWEPGPPQSREDIPMLPGSLLTLWQNWDALKPLMNRANPAWVPPTKERAGGDDKGVIKAFNEKYTAHELLERNAYTAVGVDRYLPPKSTTGIAGVKVFENGRVFSHNGSDPLNDGHSHDPFSVFTILEHAGDAKAAYEAAARELGLWTEAKRGVRAAGFGGTQDKTEVDDDEEPWEPLKDLPALYPPVPSLPPEMLPEPLQAWLQDVAERTCLPLEFVACPALVALGAVIGRALGVRPKRHDDWLVVPNLWGGIVGRPGLMKSAAISEATKPLARLAVEAREAFEKEKLKAEVRRERITLEIAALKEDAKRSAKKGGKARDVN